MTVTLESLKEEMDAVYRFIYLEHHDEWNEFCENRRKNKGAQHLESMSMLIESLTQPQPWRYIFNRDKIDALIVWLSNMKDEGEELQKTATAVVNAIKELTKDVVTDEPKRDSATTPECASRAEEHEGGTQNHTGVVESKAGNSKDKDLHR